jgi:hypothetical protein
VERLLIDSSPRQRADIFFASSVAVFGRKSYPCICMFLTSIRSINRLLFVRLSMMILSLQDVIPSILQILTDILEETSTHYTVSQRHFGLVSFL